MLRFHNALYACDVLRRIAVFGDVGLRKHTPLARSQDFTLRPRPLTYLTAKTNGLEEAAEILQAAGLTEANVEFAAGHAAAGSSDIATQVSYTLLPHFKSTLNCSIASFSTDNWAL
jgi:hypothetical protein